MIEKLDLSDLKYQFEPEAIDFKEVNYIYGANGTGKTTITKKLLDEAQKNGQDIRIFDGYARYLEEETGNLNTIVLGQDNVQYQADIKKIEKEINTLREKIDTEIENSVGFQKESLKREYDVLNQELRKMMTDKAREIRRRYPEIGSFDRGHLRQMKAQDSWKLDSEDLQKYQLDLKAIKLNKIADFYKFENINFEEILNSTNQLLQEKISISSLVEEYYEQPQKLKFASDGMEIHSVGDECAFCGNIYTQDRKEKLETIFTNEVDEFKNRIDHQIKIIQDNIDHINNMSFLDSMLFYDRFKETVSLANEEIDKFQNASIIFLQDLSNSLKNKKENLYVEIPPLEKPIPLHLNIEKINNLIDENKQYHQSILERIECAKDRIKKHESYLFYKSEQYFRQEEKIKRTQMAYEKIEKEFKETVEKMNLLESDKRLLELKFSSDQRAIENINEKLKYFHQLGFELGYHKLERDGEYCIQDKDGDKRLVKTLSEGEKNIIAFLWFIEHLQDKEQDLGDKIVVFDDPMSSNDSYSQYLMISEIKNLISKRNSMNIKQIFMLTHNPYFYRQVVNQNKYDEKSRRTYNYIHLYKRTKESNVYTKIVSITNKYCDIRDMYEDLWMNLYLCYEDKQNIVMWNLMRRILETYVDFYYNNSSIGQLNQKLSNQSPVGILANALIQSLHINSHTVLYQEVDLTLASSDELLDALQLVFENIGAKKHYESYLEAVKKRIE